MSTELQRVTSFGEAMITVSVWAERIGRELGRGNRAGGVGGLWRHQ